MGLSSLWFYAVEVSKLKKMSLHLPEFFDRGINLSRKCFDREPDFSISFLNLGSVVGHMQRCVIRRGVVLCSRSSLACSQGQRLKLLPVALKRPTEESSASFPVRLDREAPSPIQATCHRVRLLPKVADDLQGRETNRKAMCLQPKDRFANIGELGCDKALNFQGIWSRLLRHQLVMALLSGPIRSLHRCNRPPCSQHCEEATYQSLELGYEFPPRIASRRHNDQIAGCSDEDAHHNQGYRIPYPFWHGFSSPDTGGQRNIRTLILQGRAA